MRAKAKEVRRKKERAYIVENKYFYVKKPKSIKRISFNWVCNMMQTISFSRYTLTLTRNLYCFSLSFFFVLASILRSNKIQFWVGLKSNCVQANRYTMVAKYHIHTIHIQIRLRDKYGDTFLLLILVCIAIRYAAKRT